MSNIIDAVREYALMAGVGLAVVGAITGAIIDGSQALVEARRAEMHGKPLTNYVLPVGSQAAQLYYGNSALESIVQDGQGGENGDEVQLPPREYPECYAPSTARFVRQNPDGSYDVLVPDLYEPKCGPEYGQ